MLPTEKRKPVSTLSDNIIFGYGIPKIGKSSFFGQFPDALFLSTEEGLNHLEVFESPISKWLDFCMAVTDLEKNPTQFKTAIIDTADNLFMFCQDFVYNKNNISHESDLEWGKGWKLVEREFRAQVTRLSKIKSLGLCFVSHSEEREVKRKGWDETTIKVTHTLPNKARKLIHGMADIILYFENDSNNNRVIRTKPSTEYEAGDRTGRLPATVPMGSNPETAYENFVNAYYGDGETAHNDLNKQIETGLAYLKDNGIDGFNSPKRTSNSMNNHLGCANLKNENITLAQKQAYLQHLRAVANNPEKEKK